MGTGGWGGFGGGWTCFEQGVEPREGKGLKQQRFLDNRLRLGLITRAEHRREIRDEGRGRYEGEG